MSDILLEINEWIGKHQALVVASGVPILTAVAAGIVTVITTRMNLKAQRLDRELRQKMKRIELEQMKIDQLRAALTEFESVTSRLGFDVRQGLSAGQVNAIPKEIANAAIFQLIDLVAKIAFIVGPKDPDSEALSEALELSLRSVYDPSELKKADIDQKLIIVGKRIIARLEDAQRAILT